MPAVELRKRMGPWLRELAIAARGSQDAEICIVTIVLYIVSSNCSFFVILASKYKYYVQTRLANSFKVTTPQVLRPAYTRDTLY